MADLTDGVIDVPDMLEVLADQGKLRNLTYTASEANFSCPFGGHSYGDSHASTYMNLHTTAWICHGCGRRGNAIRFLSMLENVPPYLAALWLEKRYAQPQFYGNELPDKVRELMKGKAQVEEKSGTPIIGEDRLEDMVQIDWPTVLHAWHDGAAPEPLAYLLDRGFMPETLMDAGICFDERSARLAIPVRDALGRLVGFKGRAWHQDQQPRYMALGDTPRSVQAYGERYGFQPYRTAAVLWGMDSVLIDDGLVIVTEGELNAMKMREYGWRNVVGLSGSYLSEEHISFLRSVAYSATLRFDARKDGAFLQYVDDSGEVRPTPIADAADRLNPFLRTRLCPVHEGDPASMSREDVEALLSSARSLLEHRVSLSR